MPLPLSHIVYADKLLNNKFKDPQINKQEFFIGSTFPDIRYLLKVDRQITHSNCLNSSEVWEKIEKENNSFELGILTHIYTDYKFSEYWSDYLKQNHNDYYPLLVIENQILFNEFDNDRRDLIKSYFDSIINDEVGKYNSSKKIITKWHELVKMFLSKNADYEMIDKIVEIIGVEKGFTDKIWERVKILKKDGKINNRITKFKNSLWLATSNNIAIYGRSSKMVIRAVSSRPQ